MAPPRKQQRMPEQPQLSPFKRHLYGAAGLAALIVLYLLPGSIGHDPWRGDDIRHFSAVFSLFQDASFWLPSMAGAPVTDFGPLYYWVSAIFGAMLGWLLPLHDATRLASPFFTGLAIFWIARAAARLYGRHTRTPAALLMLGTLGLVVHAHEHQPYTALIAMQAMTLAGLALVPTQPVKGALQAGIGVALAFLAAGPSGALLTLPLLIVVAIGCPECRSARASGALILGLSIGTAIAAAWLIGLERHDPNLVALWWEGAWSGLGEPISTTDLGKLAELLSWFAWPLWPIALWTLWRARFQLLRVSWALPLVATLCVLLWLFLGGHTQAPAMLPIIAPLALLAAAGVPTLRRGAANAFDWFAIMTFGSFAIFVWLAWTAQAHGWPPGLARSLERVAPEFVLHGTLFQAAIASFITLCWITLVWHLPRSPNRSPTNWAMGMTMLWCLAVSLLLPWFDHGRSYRPASESLAIALAGEAPGCVAGIGLSDSHLASFDYFAGLRVDPVGANLTACKYLLVHDETHASRLSLAAQWQLIWEFRHAGGKRLEVFRLYRRE